MNYRVISIGALASHPLREERAAVRTGHATTILIEAPALDDSGESVRILVDPGLPAQALVPRLEERAGLAPADITHVFLTTFHPEARRTLEVFDTADWLLSEAERESIGIPLAQSLMRLRSNFESPDEEVAAIIERDIALLQRCRPAPDHLAKGVDLFPLPGITPGCSGLLLAGRQTVLICGDAIPTAEHLVQGKVLKDAHDIEQAQESFREAIEIADMLIPGRDNLVVNPGRGAW